MVLTRNEEMLAAGLLVATSALILLAGRTRFDRRGLLEDLEKVAEGLSQALDVSLAAALDEAGENG